MNEKWGLVFSGGGAKGAYEIGVWQAMEECGLREKTGSVSGASIGALNAVLFAGSTVEKAVKAWKQVNLLTVFDTEWSKIDGIEGFALRDGMISLIKDYVDESKLFLYSDSVYASLARVLGNEQFMGEYYRMDGVPMEKVEQILAASSAMPIVYETVMIDGKPYRDGGLCDNVPIQPLYDEGYRKIILVGLKEKHRKFEAKYPDVEFWSVYPSHSLGELDGTLDFRQEFITFCRKLGYYDAKRRFEAYMSGNWNEELLKMQAKVDYDRIMAEMRYEKLQKSVDGNMNSLNKMLGKYGVEL